jgi:ATP-dependent DNA ligase
VRQTTRRQGDKEALLAVPWLQVVTQFLDPPPIGSWVTYAYNGITASGIPRFARFVRIRDDVVLEDARPMRSVGRP